MTTMATTAEASAPVMIAARDVARLLSVSERTIWQWAADGHLPRPVKIGRVVRWHRQTIDAWAAAAAQESGASGG